MKICVDIAVSLSAASDRNRKQQSCRSAWVGKQYSCDMLSVQIQRLELSPPNLLQRLDAAVDLYSWQWKGRDGWNPGVHWAARNSSK